MIKKLNEIELLENYGLDKNHMQRVSILACLIFDKLNDVLFFYNDKHREYLKIASMLHDIGYYRGSKKHNKNSCKIIKENLIGFDEDECLIIGNIARYHRGKMPDKKKHRDYSLCDKNTKKIIKNLSAILKIADGLDCLHDDIIKNIKIKINKNYKIIKFYIKVYNKLLTSKLLKNLLKKKDLFENVYKIQVIFYIN